MALILIQTHTHADTHITNGGFNKHRTHRLYAVNERNNEHLNKMRLEFCNIWCRRRHHHRAEIIDVIVLWFGISFWFDSVCLDRMHVYVYVCVCVKWLVVPAFNFISIPFTSIHRSHTHYMEWNAIIAAPYKTMTWQIMRFVLSTHKCGIDTLSFLLCVLCPACLCTDRMVMWSNTAFEASIFAFCSTEVLHKHRHRHGQFGERVFCNMKNSNCNYYYCEELRSPHTLAAICAHAHICTSSLHDLFIHSYIRSFIENLISYCRKCFSSCIFIVSIPYMHCSGGVHSNTPFDAAPTDSLLLLLSSSSSSLVCVAAFSISLSLFFIRISCQIHFHHLSSDASCVFSCVLHAIAIDARTVLIVSPNDVGLKMS